MAYVTAVPTKANPAKNGHIFLPSLAAVRRNDSEAYGIFVRCCCCCCLSELWCFSSSSSEVSYFETILDRLFFFISLSNFGLFLRGGHFFERKFSVEKWHFCVSPLSLSLSHTHIYIYIGIRSKNDDRARDRAFRAMKVDDASLFQAYSHLIKILLVGDSGVGKTSVLSRFIDPEADLENVSTTIGVDFKLKYVTSKRTNETVKLTVWDTAGQERFRTLTSSYYRGAQGVVFVYDICSRESFDSIENVWQKEVDMYSTIPDAIKIVVGNKIDKEEERKVKKEDAIAFAKRNGCLFLECSAKTKVSVKEIFDELLQAIMETPSLLKDGPSSGRRGGGVNLNDARGDGNIVTRNCCS